MACAFPRRGGFPPLVSRFGAQKQPYRKPFSAAGMGAYKQGGEGLQGRFSRRAVKMPQPGLALGVAPPRPRLLYLPRALILRRMGAMGPRPDQRQTGGAA